MTDVEKGIDPELPRASSIMQIEVFPTSCDGFASHAGPLAPSPYHKKDEKDGWFEKTACFHRVLVGP